MIQTEKLLSVVVQDGVMRLKTPDGYIIRGLIGTLLDHDVTSVNYPLASCSFSGYIYDFGPVFYYNKEAPRLKNGKLITPDGEEIYLTGGFDIRGVESNELAYYEARTWVKLNDTL